MEREKREDKIAEKVDDAPGRWGGGGNSGIDI